MDDDRNPENGQAHVPKPPSRAEIEKISEAQKYITDDWTGDGGKPADAPEQKSPEQKDG
ncbi:hypothetical protein [Azospirillum sp. sgz302134]